MAELLLYSEIVSPSLRKMCDAGMDAELFAQQLGETSGDLTVRINSPGGDVDNGLAIYNQLQAERAKGRRVTCIVDGGAHSIASVIAMAGDEIRIAKNATMMIHNPQGFAAGEVKAQGSPTQRPTQWVARIAGPEEGRQFFQQLRAVRLVVDQFALLACLVPTLRSSNGSGSCRLR